MVGGGWLGLVEVRTIEGLLESTWEGTLKGCFCVGGERSNDSRGAAARRPQGQREGRACRQLAPAGLMGLLDDSRKRSPTERNEVSSERMGRNHPVGTARSSRFSPFSLRVWRPLHTRPWHVLHPSTSFLTPNREKARARLWRPGVPVAGACGRTSH